VVLPAILAGLGGAVCYFAMSVLLTSEIEHEYAGLGSGLFNAGRQVGGSIGLAALVVVAASHTRSLRGSDRMTNLAATASGYGLALLIAAALAVVGFALVAAHTVSRSRPRSRAAPSAREVQPSEGS
jgi:MFS family permease